MILGVNQTAFMNAIVDGFCHDHEVANIKGGIGGQGLCVWGRITYKDVFGGSHYTRFCQQLYWDRNTNILRGFYLPGRNDAT